MSLADEFDQITSLGPPKKKKVAAPVDTVRLKNDIADEKRRRGSALSIRGDYEKEKAAAEKYLSYGPSRDNPKLLRMKQDSEDSIAEMEKSVAAKSARIGAKQDTLNKARKP